MNKQIVILAGGESSRFYPFNLVHKSLFTLAGQTILQRTISKISKKYDAEIIMVLGDKNFETEKRIIENFGHGGKLIFSKQKEALGMSDAILSAKKYLKGEFIVINSQQMDLCDYLELFANKLKSDGSMAVVGCQETDTPWNYGILEYTNNKPSGLVEKPKRGEEPSSKRVAGMYFFGREFIDELEKTPISQYSLEETLDRIAKQGKLSSVEIEEKLLSLKYPWDLFMIKDMILNDLDMLIDESAEIAKTAIIKGDVYIGKKAKVFDYSIIEGPAYIGEGAVVGSYSQVRGGTILEKNSSIQRYVDIKNSILGENSSIHSGFVGDSIIGSNVKIGAGFTVANKRLDRKNIKVIVKGEKIDAGINNLGIFIGDNSAIGINASSMPGSIVDPNVIIYPKQIIK